MFEQTTLPAVIITVCALLSIALIVYRRRRPHHEPSHLTPEQARRQHDAFVAQLTDDEGDAVDTPS